MNWKLRLKNKTTLTTLLLTVITAVYAVLATLGVTPSITQEQTTNLVVAVIAILAALGVVVDPTTPGVSDSERVMGYTEPGTPGGRED